jgi:anaerobic ribonucleoside-triphosphate reductase activating protein
MNWRLNKIQYPVYNLGPGRRVGIWAQGCDLGCEGCVNQTLWNAHGGRSISVLELFNWLVSLDGEFDGITISGGEPFQQYEAFMAFLHLVKNKTPYDVYCFTGYYLSELNEMFPDQLFSRYIDFLIDGRYVAELHEDSNLKGSSNQTIYRFVDGSPVVEEGASSVKWSLKVDEDDRIYMAGIPKRRDLETVCLELARVGIRKEFR